MSESAESATFCRKCAGLVAKLSKLNKRNLHGNLKYKIQNGKPFIHYIALGIQHAMRMRHIVICGLPRSKEFFHIISYNAGF
jgi:hypothetical protein